MRGEGIAVKERKGERRRYYMREEGEGVKERKEERGGGAANEGHGRLVERESARDSLGPEENQVAWRRRKRKDFFNERERE